MSLLSSTWLFFLLFSCYICQMLGNKWPIWPQVSTVLNFWQRANGEECKIARRKWRRSLRVCDTSNSTSNAVMIDIPPNTEPLTMALVVWNMWGLNSPEAQAEEKSLLNSKKIWGLVLLETKIETKLPKIIQEFGKPLAINVIIYQNPLFITPLFNIRIGWW